MSNPYPFPANPVVNLAEVIVTGTSAQSARSKANDAWALGYAGTQNLTANFALFLITYLNAGRFVGDDATEGEPEIGTGLTLRQPNATLLTSGRVYVVAEPEPSPYQVITGILGSKSGGIEVYAGISPTTGKLYTLPEWQPDALPVTAEEKAVVAGLLHLGHAVTSASAVTSFTPSTIQRAGIISPPGTLSGDDSPATGDGPTADQFNALMARVQILEDSQIIQDADIANLKAAAGDGSSDFPTTEDQQADEIAINRAGLAEVNAHSVERGQISVVVIGSGHGQDDTPDYMPTTGDANELPWDEATGTLGT